MANLFSLCNNIEEFLQKNDQNSINQFLNWIKQRLNISSDKSLINTSQLFNCQCGHRYSLRFDIIKDDEKIFHSNNEQRKIDELQSLEQLIPPDTTAEREQNITHFSLPKLTDSIVEIIQPDGKRQFRCPLCFNSYVNRSGLNRHYITHSSQDLWKVECQFCGKRYSRKDSLKHHIKTQHTQFVIPNWLWKDTNERIDSDDIVLVT